MDKINILYFCMLLFVIIIYIIMIVKEIKTARRQPPNGKIFKAEFTKIIEDINKAQTIGKYTFLYAFQNNCTFKVSVKQGDIREGLEYRTIPVYQNFDIYINDELVCIAHIFKNQYHVEFSSKRERDEVIALIKESHKHATEIIQKDIKEWEEKLGLNKKSFFKSSDTEDK